MTARFVLDELDLDLPPFAPRLVVVVVIVIGGGADTRSFDAAAVPSRCTGAGRKRVILSRRRLLWVVIGDVGHCDLIDAVDNSQTGILLFSIPVIKIDLTVLGIATQPVRG